MEKTMVVVRPHAVHERRIVIEICQRYIFRSVNVDGPGDLPRKQKKPEDNTPCEEPLGHMELVNLVVVARPPVENQYTDTRVSICTKNGKLQQNHKPRAQVAHHCPESRVVELVDLHSKAN